MVVYVDILITINFMIDFIIIRLAALFGGMRVSVFRCALGAFIGALSSLIVFVPAISSFALFIFKIAVCVIMATASFTPVSAKKLAKMVVILCAISFIMSGVFTFISDSFLRDRMSVYRGTVYFDIGLPAMLLSVTCAYIAVRFLAKILKSRFSADTECALTITTKYGSCIADAIIDTGCSVTEPFSGEPVIICDSKIVFNIVPQSFFEGTNFRLVPFKTINGTGMLKAFRSEYVVISTDRYRYRKEGVFIAAGETGGCTVINPAILNDAEREGAFAI